MKLKNLFLTSLVCVLFASFFVACDDGDKPNEPTERVFPRHFATQSGKVYVTLFDGYLACIDTTSMSIVNQVKVGRNPEGVAIANNQLYVANSGGMDFNTETGYDKTVSVVNVNNFSVSQSLEVTINPAILAADSKGDVYLISNGNYNDVPATLQRIDAQTQEVTVISEVSGATYMSMYNDKLYVICSQYDSNWNQTANCIVYDAVTEKVITENFVTDGTNINSAYSISVDPTTGNVYMGMSDYVNTGDMYVFSPQGKLIKQFETKGLNPIGAFFDGLQYVYILNSGNWGSNDASLVYYNSENGSLTDIFYDTNQIRLGDTAQDMIVYGSKIYVAVYGSQIIFVLDKNGLILKTILYRN